MVYAICVLVGLLAGLGIMGYLFRGDVLAEIKKLEDEMKAFVAAELDKLKAKL